MTFKINFLKEAADDYKGLDGSQKIVVNKALKKISLNPHSEKDGGYGKTLANHNNSKLAGCLKCKLKSSGIRIIYKIEKHKDEVLIIIIGMREDSKVYKEAAKRVAKLK